MIKQLHEYSLACAVYRAISELDTDEERIDRIERAIKAGYVDGRLDGLREAANAVRDDNMDGLRLNSLKDDINLAAKKRILELLIKDPPK